MKKSGIYMITNVVNNKRYIGQSIDMDYRKHTHFYQLQRNKHYNRYLQGSFNKHGENNFIFSVLLYCEKFELTRYEQFFVDSLDPEFNILKDCVVMREAQPASRAVIMRSELTYKIKRNKAIDNKIINNINKQNTKKFLYVDKNGNIKSKLNKPLIVVDNNRIDKVKKGITDYQIEYVEYVKQIMPRRPKQTDDILDKCETVWNILVENKETGVNLFELLRLMKKNGKKISESFITTFQSNNYLFYYDGRKIKPFRHPSGLIIE